MEKIVIRKRNEVYITVECESSTEREIADFFTFFVPGYRFMPAFRNKMWDGKIRLFDVRSKLLYAGLVPYLKDFAAGRDMTIEFPVGDYGSADSLESASMQELVTFAAGLNLHAHGKPIIPRNYQMDALKHSLETCRSLLLSPTASGKSLIIYMMIRWFHTLGNIPEKVLLIVPTTSLVEQMYTDFADYASHDPSWNNEQECHRIYSGKEKIDINQRVIITTWQSIFRLGPDWFAPYGMVIGDEAHTFKAKSLTSIMEKLKDAKYRIGTTGTLDGTLTHKLVLEGLFGTVNQVTTTKDLIDQDALSDFDIDVVLLKHDKTLAKLCREFTYQEEIDTIVSHPGRNRLIRNLALDQKGNTLVLYNYVGKHGKPLYEMLEKKLKETNSPRKLFFVSGGVDTDERERIRKITEGEEDAIIVASLGTFSTGINIRNLHNIIFASPSKSQIRVLQSIGRGLRKADNGQKTKVYDIADDLSHLKHRNHTLKHAADRIKLYTKERFKFKIHEVPLV